MQFIIANDSMPHGLPDTTINQLTHLITSKHCAHLFSSETVTFALYFPYYVQQLQSIIIHNNTYLSIMEYIQRLRAYTPETLKKMTKNLFTTKSSIPVVKNKTENYPKNRGNQLPHAKLFFRDAT